MTIASALRKQRPSPPIDESVFDHASLVFKTHYTFDVPPARVWRILDGERMFEWLPFPGVGVSYESAERGVGVVREMGSIAKPFRGLWIQREQFWSHEEARRISYGAISGTWMYVLLVWHYTEEMTLVDTSVGGTDLTWTVAVAPRLPLRVGTLPIFAPLWRLNYRTSLRGPMTRRLAEQA
ncbi:SRPBCC family protein [Nocardia mangyaensis]|uniref:SRPBCC family protein n=1 Tax=Nocardia mangyaensis TaxID=2213200 RepID=UPI002675B840|nr:SRPBCC family protein [Nocardia mangyaensis]MDO3650653.1 SRPBCC family protein [Nocardia mangyaensis]